MVICAQDRTGLSADIFWKIYDPMSEVSLNEVSLNIIIGIISPPDERTNTFGYF